MSHKGPVFTLLVGLVLAVVLTGMSLAATPTKSTSPGSTVAFSGTETPSPAAGSAAPTKPPVPKAALYAAHVGTGRATLAIALAGGKAVAYLCDGKIEAWARGTAVAGRLAMTGKGNARLTGTYDGKAATGTLVAAGQPWTFNAPTVHKPSGLYKATAKVRRVPLVSTWIVLPDGSQIGVALIDGKPQPAPKLDPATGRANVDGTPVTATPVDPTG